MAAFDPRVPPPPPLPDEPIRIARDADLSFVLDLQRKHSGALGFLPAMAIKWYLQHGMITLATQNRDEAGYLLGRSHLRYDRRICPIYQAAVARDAQRRQHGLALVDRLAAQAVARGQLALQANCAADLDSNAFWQAAGFKPVCVITPQNARGRDLICWRKFLTKNIPLDLLTPPLRHGSRGQQARTDRLTRHQTGRSYRGHHHLIATPAATTL